MHNVQAALFHTIEVNDVHINPARFSVHNLNSIDRFHNEKMSLMDIFCDI